MALNIKSAEADRLARELAAITGESITVAVTRALHDRIERCRRPAGKEDAAQRRALKEELSLIRQRVAAYPVLDPRSDDEILGYNDIGTFD